VLLTAAVAIVASGLGKPSSVASGSPSARLSSAPIFTPIPLQAISETCVKQVGPFVSSLQDLDGGVGPNVTFHDYSQLFAASQAARSQVNISELDPPCIAVFAAAQVVLGQHAEAYNIWNDCNTTTGCTRQSIQSSLDDHWASAKATLTNVKASMP
jgi:hypothetical protein